MTEDANDRAEKGINMTISPDSDANQHDHADELVKQLRERSCPAGEPWTGDAPEEDHGHTDCWLHYQSVNEIERLRAETQKLAKLLMHEYVFVHERIIEHVDQVLKPYLGGSNE
jgi:hypothetical protein